MVSALLGQSARGQLLYAAKRFKPARFLSSKVSKPLRILYCGSDDFSSASLRALHAEQQRDLQSIASIDVMCRPGKRTGRSLKKVREVPIKGVAQQLSLPIHERDTFRGWELPIPETGPINLIIAVSFGLFVPSRILKSAEYGGLNVHPSLLPHFRGPAPLQHTLISGEEYTGVTLQTLDEKTFDHGKILAQTPFPGLKIPNAASCTYSELLDFIAPKAAELLVQGIRDKVYVPPLLEVGWHKQTDPDEEFRHAPKITPRDRNIDLSSWTSVEIERRNRVLGRLWTRGLSDDRTDSDKLIIKRFVLEDLEITSLPKEMSNGATLSGEGRNKFKVLIGDEEVTLPYIEDANSIIVPTCDGMGLRIKEITIEGEARKPASIAIQKFRTSV
ncbi:methionyl-tRNA formyltransferase family protein [Xylogone sp. PMI_703]|nr:methionyl-tRNA formyltransferase family protein [Xylogone sp. PMI_703]